MREIENNQAKLEEAKNTAEKNGVAVIDIKIDDGQFAFSVEKYRWDEMSMEERRLIVFEAVYCIVQDSFKVNIEVTNGEYSDGYEEE